MRIPIEHIKSVFLIANDLEISMRQASELGFVQLIEKSGSSKNIFARIVTFDIELR